MSRFIEFAANHPVLMGLLLALIVIFFLLESRRQGAKISPQQLGILTNSSNAMIVDLREPKDFNSGHIAGSTSIPFSRLSEHLEMLKSHEGAIVFVCKMGTVSGSAVTRVDSKQAYRLAGGIINWQSSGLPLVGNKSAATPSKKSKNR